MRRRLPAIFVLLALLFAGVAVAAGPEEGRVGPSQALLGNGRHLEPTGKLVDLGNFPTGGALTRDGRFLWTVSTGRGFNDIRIVSVADQRVVQTIPIPGSSGGIAMDPSRDLAYVSGVADSEHADQSRPDLPGREGDNVQVFSYDASSGQGKFSKLIAVPPPSGTLPPQAFPPTDTKPRSWPDRLAVSADGGTLLVPLNLADSAAIVDTAGGGVRYVRTGRFPYGAAIAHGGKVGLVSNEVDGTVSAIDLASGTKLKDIQVGAHLSHPEAIAADPKAARAYVTVANSDNVAVIDTDKLAVERTLSVGRPDGLGTAPVDVTVDPDGRRLLVAESGANEIAVFALPGAPAPSTLSSKARRELRRADRAQSARAGGGEAEEGEGARASATTDYELIGRVPTADYPAAVQARPAACAASPVSSTPSEPSSGDQGPGDSSLPRGGVETGGGGTARAAASTDCLQLAYVAAKGLGVGPNPNGPNPLSPNDSDDAINKFRYLPSIVDGKAGVVDSLSDDQVRQLTPVASRQIQPANPAAPPAGTPVRPNGPIKHVFYVVRENRTYDQVLGDEPRGDGDPSLNLFGNDSTPNLRALVKRFPLVDHVYANSEASIDGHFWTSAAKVSDYVHKNWFQNYAARGRPYDFGVYAVTWPGNRFLFDQAQRDGISYFNYGEAIAGTVPLVTDKDRTSAENAEVAQKFANSDLGRPLPGACYPNDAYINENPVTMQETWDSTPPAGAPGVPESRFDCFKTRFNAQAALGAVPAFNYLVLPNDHTVGTRPGERTPKALVADNDYGLGQIVQEISSKPEIWNSSAIFVIEDDSQDGADHVDAHRIPAAVISPYAKCGAVVHDRYDFLSVIRTMELMTGMKPLGLFDQLATPMYSAFQSTPCNSAPYSAQLPAQDRNERNSAAAPNARRSQGLNLDQLDRVPQRELDRILWQSVHGRGAPPPPSGPNAQPGG